MAKVAICMAMDIIYTVLLIRLGSNSLYRSTNRSSLQQRKEKNVMFYFVKTELLFTLVLSLPVSYLGGLLLCASL